MRIFSSAEYCLRVARRMSLIALVAPVCRVCDFCLIFVPFGHYDEPEILPYAIPLFCPIGADVRQFLAYVLYPDRYFHELSGTVHSEPIMADHGTSEILQFTSEARSIGCFGLV